jgi:hypothetical protein
MVIHDDEIGGQAPEFRDAVKAVNGDADIQIVFRELDPQVFTKQRRFVDYEDLFHPVPPFIVG